MRRTTCLVVLAATGGLASVDRSAADEPVPFTEEAVARGVGVSISSNVLFMFGAGVAFADLDGDGDADLVTLGRSGGVIGLFENDGTGSFSDRATGGSLYIEAYASGISAADYDADGDLDLYVSCWLEPNLLLRNDGDFAFTDVTAVGDVGDPGAGVGCAWGDYDADGHLDLYVCNYSQADDDLLPNRLYRNLGDGTFDDLAVILGVDDGDSPSFQPTFFDHDRDGDADLYLSTDKGSNGEINRLFENVDGMLVDLGEASGANVSMDGMGVACGDLDRNGYPDLYITNTLPGNVLLMNQGDGTYADESAEAGVECNAVGWGTILIDYDHDGIQELFVCNRTHPDRLYDHDGAWPAVDVAPELGVDYAGETWCAAAADIDLDGDVDLIVQNLDRMRLYLNHEGTERAWARFDVRGPAPNRFAVGATVDVEVAGQHQVREVAAGRGYKTQDEMPVHFGLDQAQVIDAVTVTWPGGVTRTFTGLPANTTWTLRYPGDINGDGSVDVADLVMVILNWGPCPVPPAGCAGDDNLDGTVDVTDLVAVVVGWG